MPVSNKRKLFLARAERALEGQRAKRAHLDNEEAPLNPVETRSVPMYGPHDGNNHAQLSENSLTRRSVDLAEDSDDSSGDESDSDEELTGRQMYNKPPTSLEAGIALKKLDAAIRVPKPSGGYVYANMDRVTSERCAAMKACLNHYLDPKSKGFIDASERAVRGQSQGSTHARSIRRWICQFIKSGDLPKNKNGWWNVSTLEDKDVSSEIKLHLQQVGKFARAKDVVDFLRNPNTHARLKIVKKISIRTVQRWLSRAGYRWRTEPKGQYFDGHECEDVVAYCQSIFIPFWRALERRRIIFNEEGIPDPWRPMMLLPGEKPVIFWFHDESIFYANNRRLVQWVYIGEHPKPFKKGEGCSVMADDFFCPEWGWLRGLNGQSARVILSPGQNRDRYFSNERVIEQLKNAIKIVQDRFPHHTHVFVYDNAPSHTKCSAESICARRMPKGPSAAFPYYKDDENGKIPLRMEDGRLPDGRPQSFYFPNDHPEYSGYFKGMEQILRERGLDYVADKRFKCPGFKCKDGTTDCCCRRALFCQPDFQSRDSSLAEVGRKLGSQVIFLPKYHCELNPIEQCWGYAKRKYRDMPPSNKESVLKKNMLEAIDSVPLLSMRKFAARTQRFIDAYASGSSGAEAIKWATKEFKGHRQTPAHIPFEQIAPTYVHR